MATSTNYESPGLVTQNNSEYYTGEKTYVLGASGATYTWPTELTPLIWTDAPVAATPKAINNYDVYIDNVLMVPTVGGYTSDAVKTILTNSNDPATATQIVEVNYIAPITVGSLLTIRLQQNTIWDNYQSYQYNTLKDIVANFMLSYVGTDRTILRAKRSEVIFHAKRGLQEFSYDTLKSVNIQELTIPANLSLPLPQDYVNYVQLSHIDNMGIKHIIYPTTLTTNPTAPLIQDNQGIPTQDDFGNNLESQQSITNENWRNANQRNLTGTNFESTDANVYNWNWWKTAYGQRYGMQPEISQQNGWFTIDDRRGAFAFSGDLQGKLITLEYISDGLAYGDDTKVPKMAEDALYSHMLYSITATRNNIPEYVVQRYKKDRATKLRNAKIRLSNIKLSEFTQVMRGKSKWIKH